MFALALGHEDVNDHDHLRHDRLLALACGRKDLDGATRRRERDRGIPLAGKSTLNRLEDCSASAADHHRHHRIAADIAAMDALLVALFVESFGQPPDRIVLDVDATDMPLHGRQEGRFFHGCHDEYCHLPLYIFCGERLLCAKLRTSNRDAGDGLVEELERIVPQLRAAWPETRIVVRGQRRPPPVRPGPQQAAAGRDRDADEGEAAGRGRDRSLERGRVAAVPRLPVPDAQELEPGAAGGRQGRTHPARAEPALRGHLAAERGARRTGAV